MKRLTTLLISDAKNTVRDDIMLIITVVPIFLSLLVRFGEPFLRSALEPYIDLRLHHGAIIAVLTSMTPMMYGWIIGFLLLDDRDEHTLSAIAVTPFSKRGYLLYRTLLIFLLSCVLTTVLVPLTGLAGLVLPRFIPIAVMTSLEAPLFALALAAFSGNKVEGMAIAKFMGLMGMLPLLPFYIDSPLVYIAGITPFFWVGKSVLLMEGSVGAYILSVAAGYLIHAAYLALFLWIFNRRVEE